MLVVVVVTRLLLLKLGILKSVLDLALSLVLLGYRARGDAVCHRYCQDLLHDALRRFVLLCCFIPSFKFSRN